MVRFFLRRIPRFGFLALFAAMLLFVSAAGWVKFHLDLWRDEETLLADLAKAGIDVSYSRAGSEAIETRGSSPSPGSPILWNAATPFFFRIDQIGFRDATSRDLVERAARLPYVEAITDDRTPNRAASLEQIAAVVGFDLPAAPTPSVPSTLPPLPRGERVDGDEASAAVASFLEFWEADRPPPNFGTADSTIAAPPTRLLYARDGNLHFTGVHGAFVVSDRRSYAVFQSDGAGFVQTSRMDGPEDPAEIFGRDAPPLVRFNPKANLKSNLLECEIESQFLAALRSPEAIRVERIDERTYRLDLPPVTLKVPVAHCEEFYAVSVLVRSDLDWTFEAYDIVGTRIVEPNWPAILPPAASASFRGTLRREREFVVAEAWVADWFYAQPPAADGPRTLHPTRNAGVARYDFSPDLDLSHVTPAAFDADRLPPRRELPWLPWHRATFALSLGIFAFVGARRLMRSRRSEQEENPPTNPLLASGERKPSVS